MSLSKQIHLYSVGTDAFYTTQEQDIHQRLLILYSTKKKIKKYLHTINNKGDKAKVEYTKEQLEEWRVDVNKAIAEEKEQLTILLDNSLKDTTPRQLNPDTIKDKNVISLFVSALTDALGIPVNSLTDKLFVVNVFFFQVFEHIVKNGFEYNGKKYIFLSASAGQIRTKRAVFIKASDYEIIQMKLMCGLTIDKINQMGGTNPNKFNAYFSLNNSATDVWDDFDIDKSIVVDDFETEVPGVVDFISDEDYSINRKKMNVPIPHMDGCGIMLSETTRMVRLPWVKGLLVRFPFDMFIKEKCTQEQQTIYDIYGHPHDVIAEGIKYIFTKSQFKMWKFYSSWDEYKQAFKQYGCEARYCNIEEPYIATSRINYQMLQTLTDMHDNEITKLVQPSVEEIAKIGQDFRTTMRLLGATEYNQNPSYFQEALMLYPELFKDGYSKEILKQTKKSLIKQAKGGRLRVNGKYYFISPDLYAFCEWLFLDIQNPQGLLKDGEVYCREFNNGDEVACLRSPHLYREWAVRKVVSNPELDKWFGGTLCCYTSTHDFISKILMFDCDGDKALVIKDRLLTKVAKRNMKGIVPLFYNMKKAKDSELNPESIYQGMISAYTGGNIGPISNNITKVWNSDKVSQDQLDTVKRLCLINNEVIDYAKTLFRSTPPEDVAEVMKSFTKANVPHFFIYAKDKLIDQVEPPNQSTMNRIMQAIPNGQIRYSKTISDFDYRVLMHLGYGVDFHENNPIIASYDYWNKRQKTNFNTEDDGTHTNQEDLYVYQCIRQKILEETGFPVEYIVNTLVAYLYTWRPNSTKKLFWACFGKEIVENIKRNLVEFELGRICPICGRRFVPKTFNQITCCAECRKQLDNEKRIERKRKTNDL